MVNDSESGNLAQDSTSPTAAPMTMTRLSDELTEKDAAFSQVTMDTRDLRFAPEGIVYGEKLYNTNEQIRSRLFDKVGAPGKYLGTHSEAFQAEALSAHTRRGDFGQKPTLVLRGDELVTIVKGELFTLPNADVIRAIDQELDGAKNGLLVTRVSNTEGVLDVEIVSPAKEISVRPGDIVRSGLHIRHERFGAEATQVHAFIYRLVCSNGMTRKECVRGSEQRSRTRKLPSDFPNNRELQMGQIRGLARQYWDQLGRQLEAFQATSERPAHVEEVLIRWLQRARISIDNILPRLMAAWGVEGAERTQYGAINALTRVATHDLTLSDRQRRTLSMLAGLLAFSEVHICQACFSVLTRNTAHSAHAAY